MPSTPSDLYTQIGTVLTAAGFVPAASGALSDDMPAWGSNSWVGISVQPSLLQQADGSGINVDEYDLILEAFVGVVNGDASAMGTALTLSRSIRSALDTSAALRPVEAQAIPESFTVTESVDRARLDVRVSMRVLQSTTIT
jgi:hypothetical protein